VTPCCSADVSKYHINLLHLSSRQKIEVTGLLELSPNRSARCNKLKNATVCSIYGRGIRNLLPLKVPVMLWDTRRIVLNVYRVCLYEVNRL
jgi:hypothetical protein